MVFSCAVFSALTVFTLASGSDDELRKVTYTRDSLQRTMVSTSLQKEILQTEVQRLRDENRRLLFRLQDTERKALYLERSNSIFVLVVSISAILFLTSLLYILVRRLTSGARRKVVARVAQDVEDSKMEKIKKLMGLKAKGLITDEEAEFQKRQILSE